MERNEILTLFPSLCQYKFLQKTSSKSCIISFETAAEAATVYKTCDNIYMSRILQIDFYDKQLDESSYRSPKTARFSRGMELSNEITNLCIFFLILQTNVWINNERRELKLILIIIFLLRYFVY